MAPVSSTEAELKGAHQSAVQDAKSIGRAVSLPGKAVKCQQLWRECDAEQICFEVFAKSRN